MPPLTVYQSIKSLKIGNSTAVNEFYYSEQFLKSLSVFCSVNSVELSQKFEVSNSKIDYTEHLLYLFYS